MGILIILISLAIYLLPSIVASNRKHPNASSIQVVNILLGWTLIGWVVALAWSVSAIEGSRSSLPTPPKKTSFSISQGIAIIFIGSVLMIVIACYFVGSATHSQSTKEHEVEENSQQTKEVVNDQATITTHQLAIKSEVINRCRSQMQQYGSSLVKACVDQDLQALETIQSYPKQYKTIIDRCSQQMGNYGYSLIKACIDQDIEAEKALDHY